MIAYLVWVSPTYMENRVRCLYREHAELQQRSVDHAYGPRVIFREPGLVAAVLLVWASTASSLWQEAEDFVSLFRAAVAALPNMVPAGAEADSGFEDRSATLSADEDDIQGFVSPSPSPGPDVSPAPPSSPASISSRAASPISQPPVYEDISPPAKLLPEQQPPPSSSTTVSLADLATPLELPECLKRGGNSAVASSPILLPAGSYQSASRMSAPSSSAGAFQPYRRPAPRRPVALPLRPVSVLDDEGRIMPASAGRRLPYARLMGQQRPTSSPPPRPATPATPVPSADSSNPLGRIRITRTTNNSLQSEWVPSSGPPEPIHETVDLSNEAESIQLD